MSIVMEIDECQTTSEITLGGTLASSMMLAAECRGV